jgi:outer membrane protein assembly factor BamD (BamD/ComL family)
VATASPRSADKVAPGNVAVAANTTANISDEIALLDEVRRLLNAGDTAGALAGLDRYKSRFPSGALSPEALVLKVDALMRKGDGATATRLAHGFLKTHPDGFHAGALRALIGESKNP